LRGSLNVSRMLPGVHRVRKELASGPAEYWYAWRGGPCILTAKAKSDALLEREVERLAPAAAELYGRDTRPAVDTAFLAGLVTRYLGSLEFERLADRTRRDRRKNLDRARADLGALELYALEARGARSLLLGWRDRFKATPRTADALLSDLSAVLGWAHDRGEIALNPVKDFPRLYRVDRAAIIWQPQDVAAVLAHASEELRHAILLASHTGARLGDLRALTWSAVGQNAVSWQTGKSRGRRTAVVPITPDLRAVLDGIPRRESPNILTSARRRPWTESGLETALRKAKIAAGIHGLRWHDFRGTAATNLVRANMTEADVATVLGWSTSKVQEIARRYVTSEEVGLAILDRWKRAGLRKSHTY